MPDARLSGAALRPYSDAGLSRAGRVAPARFGLDQPCTLRGMDASVPLLSSFLPMQLLIAGARRFGYASQALEIFIRRMTSREKFAGLFAGYRPTEHDVFVTCFSKSGTNWAMQMAVQIAHRGDATFEHIHRIAAWPGCPFPGAVALEDPGPWQRSPTKLRVIKSAAPAQYVPYSPSAKYLCVARDPKEILVSAYFFLTGSFGLRDHVTPAQWCALAMKPDAILSRWPEHMASYWALRDRANVRVLLYPEMKRDLAGTVEVVRELMGVELGEAERDEVIRRSGFAYMKGIDSCFAPPRLSLLTGTSRGEMVRSGKAGKAAEFLAPELCQEIDERMLQGLAERGSDFPYAEHFMAD